jgi:hypothetical protein
MEWCFLRRLFYEHGEEQEDVVSAAEGLMVTLT